MKNKNHGKISIRYLLGLVVLLIVAMAVLELTNVTHFFHKRAPQTASQYTKGEHGTKTSNSATSSMAGSTSTNKASDGKNNGGTGPVAILLDPSGDFVSNHHPNLSGSPAPNTLTSVCTSTPGAECKIEFTKDNVTKSLPSMTTDSGGSAYWNNWTLQSIGLAAGTWQIKATVRLSGQTKTASDAMDLVVSQ